MKKGFTITFNKAKNVKYSWEIKYIGHKQMVSYFDFGDGKKAILKCANCGKIHWEDLEDKQK